MAEKQRIKMLKGTLKEEKDEDSEGADEGNEERCNNEKPKEEFILEEVLRLGGTKADYIMLAALDEMAELVDGGKKDSVDDLKEGELENFINKLGISSYAKDQLSEDTPTPKEKENKKSKCSKTEAQEHSKGEKVRAEVKKRVQKTEVNNSTGIGKKCREQNIFEFQPRKVLLIKPGGKWYNMDYTNEFTSTVQDQAVVAKYKSLAQKLLQEAVSLFKRKKDLQKDGNSSWIKTIVSAGTLADRMAAMTLLIQDAPIHSLEFLEMLVNQVKKKGSRRQGLMALDTLKELLLADLLPENRKLKTFSEHPFDRLEELSSGNRDSRDRRLILWYFESLLKHQVAEFVIALETLTHDTVVATKTRALVIAHELLCSRPEQERALLKQLVNKLGDPVYKIATKVSYLLEVLLHQHPNMKSVVCNEVESLLYRPNVHAKTQYYALCFLNQIVLSHDESDLASKLITIYFSFFNGCIKKKDVESKMLSALLCGINRAYPYAKVEDEKIREQMDSLFKVVHVVNFNAALQALMLLFQVMDSQQMVSDRYYVALYKKLLDPGLCQCSKHSMFLNLLFKSLKADVVIRRVKAFVKRLLQISIGQNAAFACGALYLVSELLKSKPALRTFLQEHAESDDEEKFEDIDDEEEEEFTDVDKEMHRDDDKPTDPNCVKPAVSWLHHKNMEGVKNVQCYDPLHRNPLYCGADKSNLWELNELSRHFHPSVALFARTILQGDFIQYSGDPLHDFTLMRFLDRFVFRNPKQNRGKENTDSVVMKPKQKLSMSNIRSLPVNSQQFLEKPESQIPADEVFFHRFFKKRSTEMLLRRPSRGGDDESVDDVDDDEFEKILDAYEGNDYCKDVKNIELDFASNMKATSKKKKKDTDDSESDDDDDDDFSNLDDEEISLGSMDEEDFGDALEEEGGAFMDTDDKDDEDDTNNTFEISKMKTGKRKKSEDLDFTETFGLKKGQKKKRGFNDDSSILAAAEEFGYMLDDNMGSKFDNIGINAMANKDNADMKQIKWELQRDDWLHGRDARTLRTKKMKFKRNKYPEKKKGIYKKPRK
ncbi:CCAAT/enhancer-binding protein zeta [Erpetoichthys calabaricus]|uniref:CCAAT/enhancer-binding protein zeta n=1 Tax=Erpetoichthys calabaricus TaxID=27687 RepID=UPI0022346929|nr:CCAAT/enhancer-binding protein zeta [Erpetoichthys calabaricus]